MKIRVCLVATIMIGAVLLYALYCKGDVKAGFRVLGVEFSLEAKDRIAGTNATAPDQIKVRTQVDGKRGADSPILPPGSK
ncbi:MAG: hypothetical protein LAP87_30195 [Acidobacteriia bacterium]|nr:hypothetical protein [Terriglobia bacterium]